MIRPLTSVFLLSCSISPAMIVTTFHAGSRHTPARPLSSAVPHVRILLLFDRKPAAGFVPLLRNQVDQIFQPALHLDWEAAYGRKAGLASGEQTIRVTMRGNCTIWGLGRSLPPQRMEPNLGWTLLEEDGEVMPESVVDCDQIARMIENRRTLAADRVALVVMYWRLAGRVVAHELMHALTGSAAHGQTDCTRPFVSNADLLVMPRLDSAEIRALSRFSKAPDDTRAGAGRDLNADQCESRPAS